jgi:hypothetical protein
MSRVVGVSAFGLNDCVAQYGAGCREQGFYLADAVLPINPLGYIRTGDSAESERTHTGLYWPHEARIETGKPLRRVPISYAWRSFVEAGDSPVRWNVGKGVSFPLSKILARHLTELVFVDSVVEKSSKKTGAPTDFLDTQVVVAIPDNLDEYGQEALLRGLKREKLKETKLIWRPVAVALSWLEKVGDDLPSRMGNSPRTMSMNDHIHVIYMGPDAIEFSTFRLRTRKHLGQYHVLPLRDRPTDMLNITGMDWTGKLIEESFGDIDHGAFWQAFTSFPEIWRSIAGKALKEEDLPRAWSQGQEWALWNPSPDFFNKIYDVPAGVCDTLKDVLRASCHLDSHKKAIPLSIKEALRGEVRRMAEVFPGGRLRGMILCGPLVPREVPPWLASELGTLSERGLKVDGDLTEPEAGRLWLCSDCDDPVAEGAAIYGRKALDEIPSYLDTMPQLSILAQQQSNYDWIPLLNAQEVLGGTEFKDTIQGRFQLDKSQRKLHAYLYKGPIEDAYNKLNDPFDIDAIPLEDISTCQARLVREVVRKLGSLETVLQPGFFPDSSNNARYGLAFAEALFMDSESKEPPETSMADMAKTPFREAVFDFPSAPDKDVVLDVNVRMRPASGLAKVDLLPKDMTFLKGRRVRLNYSSMRRAVKLPILKRGWPRTQELIVDLTDDIFYQGERLIEIFESIDPISNNFNDVIDEIRDNVLKRTDEKLFGGIWLKVHAIDQNGRACTQKGNDMIRRIASKFENDFDRLNLLNRVNSKDRVFTRASWLYTSTPHIIIEYIKDILAGDYTPRNWGWAVEAASRTFVKVEDFQILFKAIYSRAKRNILNVVPFPIQSARAICRVLIFRKDGDKGLNRQMAQLFAKRALKRLYDEENTENFQILYSQLILLLLYLLRYRRSDPSCFDPDSSETIEIFEGVMKSMEKAKEFFSSRDEVNKANRVQNIIDGFEKYLYYEGTEDVLTVLGDLAGDMA